jgi:serine/threonine protein kinase
MGDLTGQTLDRYEIIELIGEGGMATVYRARQPRLQRDVAVKVMQPALAADPTFRQRFEREAQTAANLRHPNILTVHDYGESDGGQLYLVVEYMRGGALRDALERGMALEKAVEIAAQIAEALDYAHGQGVVHRDVKPNNILLTRDERPLLADFGLVKPIQGDRRLTATGVMLGTPDYMAPEQVQGEEVDGRADVYALGVMLYEMLTGQQGAGGKTRSRRRVFAGLSRPGLRKDGASQARRG